MCIFKIRFFFKNILDVLKCIIILHLKYMYAVYSTSDNIFNL